jgi:hypothetical protein
VAALAAILTVTNAGFAQAQTQLESAYVAAALPKTDPEAAAWGQARAVEVPLTPQAAVLPALLTASIPTMEVKSLNDGDWIAFRLEWPDATRDETAIGPDQFRDAAAVQLPVNQDVPGVCMGVRGQPVNLWHWKADWQKDVNDGFQDLTAHYPNFFKDYYPFAVGNPPFKAPTDFSDPEAKRYLVGWSAGNPLSDPARVTAVEELVAHGFGTATHLDEQGVLGRGVYKDGRWSVVFARPMATAAADQAQLSPGTRGTMAVAAWDGANQEVGARKQISADFGFTVQKAPSGVAPVQPTAAPTGPLPTTTVTTAGPNNWWMIVSVGLIVVAGAFTTGALGVYYIWYRSSRQSAGGQGAGQ